MKWNGKAGKAYNRGATAAERGSSEANPHTKGSRSFAAWNAGFGTRYRRKHGIDGGATLTENDRAPTARLDPRMKPDPWWFEVGP